MSYPYQPPPPPRHRSSFFWPVLLGVLLGYILFQILGSRVPRLGRPQSEPRPVTARGDLAADEKATIALFKESGPSVVYITSLARRSYGWFDVMEVPQGTGSGFIWDRDGHVVTNFHVILNADSIKVTLSSHSTLPAAFVGGAPDKDLAVLKIGAPADKLRPIQVGTSKDLQVGQKVFAIGNPFGLDQTLTTGIVSALGRTIDSVTNRKIEGVIQTDAAINPGNSGGPLLDSAGRLIGVNTAIASPTGSSAGIGFAVPVDTVNQVVPQLIQHGRVIRPQLGVVLAEDRVARRLGVEGALVLRVQPGSSAASAGLRGTDRDENGDILLGDVIQAVDDGKIDSSDDLIAALEKRKAGDTVSVTILRGGKTLTVNITLQESR
ncbi:MAG: hypothetical protein DIJKHBIC_00731 [Thermoanaerobaculia bacterium]|nr:hypothetical protein [Thermoanaerobaculia bacterium]